MTIKKTFTSIDTAIQYRYPLSINFHLCCFGLFRGDDDSQKIPIFI